MTESLSDTRINELKKEFKSGFYKWAVTREIFDVRQYNKSNYYKKYKETDFIRIGYSNIIPRDFFIDNQGITYHDHKGMGSNYGKGIAFGEIKYILESFKEHIEVINMDEFSVKDLDKLGKMVKEYYDNIIILSNPVNIVNIKDETNFEIKREGALWAIYKDTLLNRDIKLYWSPAISKDEYYLFKINSGTIIIKSDINLDVSEIDESEYDSIIEIIPKLTKEELKNQVRVRANEVIKFELDPNKESYIIQLK